MTGDRGDPGSAWIDDHGVASALTDAVVVLAPGGAIVWVNDAFCTLLGRDRDHLLGFNAIPTPSTVATTSSARSSPPAWSSLR